MDNPSGVNAGQLDNVVYLERVEENLKQKETHLQGSSVGHSLLLDGYNMFYRNRHQSYTNFPQLAKKGGGGVAVYVRSNIQVSLVQVMRKHPPIHVVGLMRNHYHLGVVIEPKKCTYKEKTLNFRRGPAQNEVKSSLIDDTKFLSTTLHSNNLSQPTLGELHLAAILKLDPAGMLTFSCQIQVKTTHPGKFSISSLGH
ncbi:hypothetical protein OJAV_G00233240 [Oryzias javanicus]|uniref:Uncharacterized protein n=1 Tax=Oryzias javanicus TaxID=123683 RepID=A0A437C1D8_ORYJA|nr:hypothetical protein OJAV_G00233240 [Oryzias javanicus]